MSYTIIYKTTAFKAVDTHGEEVVFLMALMGDSNVYDSRNRRSRSWQLFAAAQTIQGYAEQVVPWLSDISSGSLKIRGISVKKPGVFNLPLAGWSRFENCFKRAKLLTTTVDSGGWADTRLQKEIREQIGDDERFGYFDTVTVNGFLSAADNSSLESIRSLKSWRNKPVDELATSAFAAEIAHQQVHGNIGLLGNLLYYEPMPRVDQGDPCAVEWHAFRCVERAHTLEGVENIFKAAPKVLKTPSEALLDAIENRAADLRESQEIMELARGGYRRVCDDEIAAREAREKELDALLTEKAAEQIAESAETVCSNAWYTNTGRLVRRTLDTELVPLRENLCRLGIEPAFSNEQLKRLRIATYDIQRRVEDHKASLRRGRRRGHKASIESLGLALKELERYAPTSA